MMSHPRTKWVGSVEDMDTGDTGLAMKEAILAHDDSLNPSCMVWVITSEVEMRPGEVFVERVEQGWLLDGTMFGFTCYGSCHGGKSPLGWL